MSKKKQQVTDRKDDKQTTQQSQSHFSDKKDDCGKDCH